MVLLAEEKPPQLVLIAAAGDFSTEGDALRCPGSFIKGSIDWLHRLGCRNQMPCKEVLNCAVRQIRGTKKEPSVSTVANFPLHWPRLLMPLGVRIDLVQIRPTGREEVCQALSEDNRI